MSGETQQFSKGIALQKPKWARILENELLRAKAVQTKIMGRMAEAAFSNNSRRVHVARYSQRRRKMGRRSGGEIV